MEICDSKSCTGCSACMNACPKNAIRMLPDRRGFLHPEIDPDICIECGVCERTCPQNRQPELYNPQNVFAGLAKDDPIRENSSSGGVFTLLSRQIFKQNGVVCGAGFDSSWNVKHMFAETEEQLQNLRGSKYVQSDLGSVYHEIAVFLKEGRKVLFVGTPCQVDGLKRYLKNPTDQLVTVDLLCHGAPSPAVYRRYLEFAVEKHQSDISQIQFRKKTPGWKNYVMRVAFENGMHLDCSQREGYMGGFLKDLYLRNSCYQCPYTGSNRIGDITLGDYWGYTETSPDHIEDDDRGISMILINTEIGKDLFLKIKKGLALVPRSIENAAKGNPVLIHPTVRAENYDQFWCDFNHMEWAELSNKYFPPCPQFKDPMSSEDRAYYAIPYRKRHIRHLIHCAKVHAIKILKHR